jgi:hypothetical protein
MGQIGGKVLLPTGISLSGWLVGALPSLRTTDVKLLCRPLLIGRVAQEWAERIVGAGASVVRTGARVLCVTPYGRHHLAERYQVERGVQL